MLTGSVEVASLGCGVSIAALGTVFWCQHHLKVARLQNASIYD